MKFLVAAKLEGTVNTTQDTETVSIVKTVQHFFLQGKKPISQLQQWKTEN